MKEKITILGAILLLTTAFFTGCASSGYKENVVLYTSNERPLAIEDMPAFIDGCFGKNLPVVIYVHGRGKEPNKSLSRKKIVQQIERQYDVACLMVSWDSAFPGLLFLDRSRPMSNVPGGAAKLELVLSKLPLKQNRGDGKITLLVHSMGGLVLQKAVDSGAFDRGTIFDNVLMTEPDCDAQGHVDWVKRLASSEKVFITQNANDATLEKAGNSRAPGIFALGLGVDEPKANNAHYIDLTGLVGDSHRLFAMGAMKSQVCVAETLRGILRGVSGLPAESCIATRQGPTVKLKNSRDPSNVIFKGHSEDKDDKISDEDND